MLLSSGGSNQLRMHPDLRCFTLSTEGIAIEGCPAATVEDVLALPVVRPEIDRRMRKVREIHEAQDGSGDARAKLEAAIGELGGQLADLEALALGAGRAAASSVPCSMITGRSERASRRWTRSTGNPLGRRAQRPDS